MADGEGQSKCTVGGIACDNAGSWGGKRSFSKFVTFIQYIGGLGHDAAASGRRSEASPRARHRLSGLSAPPPSPLRRGKKPEARKEAASARRIFIQTSHTSSLLRFLSPSLIQAAVHI